MNTDTTHDETHVQPAPDTALASLDDGLPDDRDEDGEPSVRPIGEDVQEVAAAAALNAQRIADRDVDKPDQEITADVEASPTAVGGGAD